MGKESAHQCRRHKRSGFDFWIGKIPWSRKWQPTPLFLPREFHEQRSLLGYSPWGCKESDTTEHAYMHNKKVHRIKYNQSVLHACSWSLSCLFAHLCHNYYFCLWLNKKRLKFQGKRAGNRKRVFSLLLLGHVNPTKEGKCVSGNKDSVLSMTVVCRCRKQPVSLYGP